MRCCSELNRKDRRGVALIAIVVILAFLSFLLATIARQTLAHRQYLKHRERQMQATWLARAGIEIAIAKLLADPTYAGETAAIMPDSHVRIEVRNERVPADIVRISSEARFPADQRTGVVRGVERHFRRLTQGGEIRLEPVK